MFVAVPRVLLVTFTITVQPPAGIEVPLAIVKLPAPAVAVTPLQVPVLPAVLIVMPDGKVSVSVAVVVIGLVFVLVMVTVRLVLPPLTMLLAANDLLIDGLIPYIAVEVSVTVEPLVPLAVAVFE